MQICCFQQDFFRVLAFREIFVFVTAKKCMDYLLATIIIRNGDFKLLRISSTIGTFLGGEENSSVDTIFQRTSWFDLRNHQKNPTTLQLQGWLSKAFNKDFQRINIKQKPASVDTLIFLLLIFSFEIWIASTLWRNASTFYALLSFTNLLNCIFMINDVATLVSITFSTSISAHLCFGNSILQ